MAALLALAAKYWPQIALGVAVLLLLGYIETIRLERDHDKAALVLETTKYDDEHKQHVADVGTWNAEVARQKASNDKLAGMYNTLVDTKNAEFQASQKLLTAQQAASQQQVASTIKPTDVIVVPNGFVVLYNSAVESSKLAINGQASSTESNQASSSGTIGTYTSFDAIAFTQAVKDNLDKYNQLALRCSKVFDIVRGTLNDTTGLDGTVSQDGRDVSSGTATAQ